MLIGHQAQFDFLKQTAQAGRLGHAYFVVGLPGVGKARLATEFSAWLMCTHTGERPCGACTACHQVAAHTHPDTYWLAPAPGSEGIAIDQIRELAAFTNVGSLTAGWRVVVLDSADELTPPAANALLKVLEEPLGRSLFLLLAHEARLVPRTIRSRCVPLYLAPVPTPLIVQHLRERGLAKPEAEVLARLAGGRPGVALTLASEPELVEQRTAWASLFRAVSGGGGWPNLQAYIESDLAAKEGETERAASRANAMLGVWLEVARDELMRALALPGLTRYPATPAAAKPAPRGSTAAAAYACSLVLEARSRLSRHAHTRLTLESLALTMPRL